MADEQPTTGIDIWLEEKTGVRTMSQTSVIEKHPVQVHLHPHKRPAIPAAITLRAYEVYCELHGEQPAMVDLAGRDCRGGFGAGELFAYLYARTFPKAEWRTRFEEGLRGQEGL